VSQLVGSILIGDDRNVATLVAQHIPGFAPEKFTALGVVRGSQLIGGAVYHNFRGHDIEVTVAFEDPRWALPGTLRALFAYPFETLRCARMTAVVARKNKRSRRLTEGLGFRLEGVARRAIDGKQDAMIYGMLREECRWLRKTNGQIDSRRTATA
jgi:RimJ/RimL family protein N-acetyltransferase